MPERHKLSPSQLKEVLRKALPQKWLVVNIQDGEILGCGNGSLQALRAAKANHPEMDLDDVAVLYNALPPKRGATKV